MYWGQITVGLFGALVVVYYLLQQNQTVVVVALSAILVYLSLRWLVAWLFRVQYWKNNPGHESRSCPNCGQYVHRLQGDRILTCKRCGWKPGWPGIRWFTHSIFVSQLRKTVVGPSLVVFVVVAFLLVSGIGAQVGETDFEEDGPIVDLDDSGSSGSVQATQTTGEIDGSSPSGISEREVEDLVFERVNERRTERPYSSFDWNERAAERARQHASDMAEHDYFNHTSLGGETQTERYSFCDGGENAHQTWVNRRINSVDGVERYTSEEELAEGIVAAWMNSDPHRERGIYGEWWSSAGVGIAITDGGKVYVVMGFCQ